MDSQEQKPGVPLSSLAGEPWNVFDFIKLFGLDKSAAQLDQEGKELVLAENLLLRQQLETANRRIECLEALCGMGDETARLAPELPN